MWSGPPLALLCGAQLRAVWSRCRGGTWGEEEEWALALVLTLAGLAARDRQRAMRLVVLLQLLTAAVLKGCQDFF